MNGEKKERHGLVLRALQKGGDREKSIGSPRPSQSPRIPAESGGKSGGENIYKDENKRTQAAPPGRNA